MKAATELPTRPLPGAPVMTATDLAAIDLFEG